jgi:hypothetical protein
MTRFAMPEAERFAAYNRLQRRRGKPMVTLDEFRARSNHRAAVWAGMQPWRLTATPSLAPLKGCLFPLWDDAERPSHIYCGAAKQEDSSYCAEHKKRCTTKIIVGWQTAKYGRLTVHSFKAEA